MTEIVRTKAPLTLRLSSYVFKTKQWENFVRLSWDGSDEGTRPNPAIPIPSGGPSDSEAHPTRRSGVGWFNSGRVRDSDRIYPDIVTDPSSSAYSARALEHESFEMHSVQTGTRSKETVLLSNGLSQ
ncbi:HAD hydrolase [Striga asiatica]|uniref:HAD hydrolase n=1 Tax=Striga asiatica TaxID=4170 RepID=A0A5A7QBW4_STRAF|nr:HAD hydrolase [Striga asiatica]